jgi:hypothetical protein
MDDQLDPIRPETSVLRVSRSAAGELVGLIHHVRTGEKRRFEGLAQLNAAARGMARRNVIDTGTGGR